MKKAKAFLYEIIYEDLKNKILNGFYTPGSFLPSEKELSSQYAVDRVTIRTSLKLLVNDDMVEKQAGVGTKVIYGCDNNEDHQPQEQKKLIGFYIMEDELPNSGLSQPYYADLFYSLEEECMHQGYQVVYSSLDKNYDCKHLIANNNLWGIVLVSCDNDALINEAIANNIPLVLLNRAKAGIASVTCNHYDGSIQAMQHLYDNGHRKIALICGKKGHLSNSMKLAGSLLFANEHNFSIDPRNMVYGFWEFDGGYEGAMRLLTGKRREDMPTAIFSFNDAMAMGAIRAIEDLGMQLGEDISIIGFDNMTQLRYFSPSLTTIDANIDLIAHVALQNIFAQATAQPFTKALTLVPAKLVRGTTVKNISCLE